MLKRRNMVIIVRYVFRESNICYITIELTFLEELILIRQVHEKSVIFVTIGISLMKRLNFNNILVS